MIELVDRAERRLREGQAAAVRASAAAAQASPRRAEIMPILRGRLAQPTGVEGRPKRMVLTLPHQSRDPRSLQRHERGRSCRARQCDAGPCAPHQAQGRRACPRPRPASSTLSPPALDAALADYVADYRAYFERNNARVGGDRIMLDPLPRVFYVAGLGIFGGRRARPRGRRSPPTSPRRPSSVIAKAEGVHGWVPLPEADMFDVEYWSLEQAKLAKQVEKPLSRASRGGDRRRERSWPRGRQGAARRRGGSRHPRHRRRRRRGGGEVDRRAGPRLRRHRRFRGRSRGRRGGAKPLAASISSSPTPARRSRAR